MFLRIRSLAHCRVGDTTLFKAPCPAPHWSRAKARSASFLANLSYEMARIGRRLIDCPEDIRSNHSGAQRMARLDKAPGMGETPVCEANLW